VAKRPWTVFVLTQVTVLAVVVFLATAIPLIIWQGRGLDAGNSAVVLAPPAIIVLVGAWFTSRLINKQTMQALRVLKEDIELAVGGKLDAIGDPLGAEPAKDLAVTVNNLIARLRAGAAPERSTPPKAGGGRTP
jgi:hypothetical protein